MGRSSPGWRWSIRCRARQRPCGTGRPSSGSEAGRAGAAPFLLVPLRGQRRALGVLEFEAVHVEPGDEAQVIEAATTLGRQLAAALENVVLFHQAVRAERELAGLMDSVDDLVVICDAELRVVRGTRAFATRAGVLSTRPPGPRAARAVGGVAGIASSSGGGRGDSARVTVTRDGGNDAGHHVHGPREPPRLRRWSAVRPRARSPRGVGPECPASLTREVVSDSGRAQPARGPQVAWYNSGFEPSPRRLRCTIRGRSVRVGAGETEPRVPAAGQRRSCRTAP